MNLNSDHSAPHPVVAANVTLNGPSDSVRAVLRVDGRLRATGRWNGWPAGVPHRIALAFNAISDPTNVYRYTLDVTSYSGGAGETSRAAGALAIVNRSASPFGAGWWLAGLEQLVLDPAGEPVFWVGGDGSILRYVPNDASNPTVWKPARLLDRPDSIVRDTGAVAYERHLHQGTRVRFDVQGRHIETVNRLGHKTTFTHNEDRLTAIDLPLPAESGALTSRYTFSYGGAGYTIDAPRPSGSALVRTTQITLSRGEVARIMDPDAQFVTFDSESGSARITARIDRRGTRTAFSYDNAQRLRASTVLMQGQGPDITVSFTNLDAVSMGTPLDSASTFTLLDGPRTHLQDRTWIWPNARGAPTKITDELGNSTEIFRNDPLFAALVTQDRLPERLPRGCGV